MRVLIAGAGIGGLTTGLGLGGAPAGTGLPAEELANRGNPGDAILDVVAERAPGGFDRVEDVLTAEELAPLADGHRTIPHTDDVNSDSPWALAQAAPVRAQRRSAR
jgi:hypothetical protein